MDFEQLVSKYHNDTATEQEKEYVEETVMNARKIAKTRLNSDKYVSFGMKLKKFFVTLIVILFLLIALFGYGYFKISSYAKENMAYGRSNADDAVINYVVENLGISPSKASISAYKRKLVWTLPFERSYYLYEYTVKIGTREYYVCLDSYTGFIESINN